MTKAQYIAFHEEFCNKMIAITEKKNADYAGAGDDPFANFRQIGGLIQTEKLDIIAVGFLTRMSDKFSRIGSFVTKGELMVKDESVEDTLLDLANYSALMAGYLKEKKLRGEYLVDKVGNNFTPVDRTTPRAGSASGPGHSR